MPQETPTIWFWLLIPCGRPELNPESRLSSATVPDCQMHGWNVSLPAQLNDVPTTVPWSLIPKRLAGAVTRHLPPRVRTAGVPERGVPAPTAGRIGPADDLSLVVDVRRLTRAVARQRAQVMDPLVVPERRARRAAS